MNVPRPKLIWSILIDLVYLAAAPFVLLILLLVSRGFTRPKFRRGLAAKIWTTPRREGGSDSFWIHAVSVGEVLTALPLIDGLREAYPGWDIRVSVSTFTGLDVARKRLDALPVFYFPLDLSPVVARFLRRHRPTAVILMELELWPNFLLLAARRGVPVLVANGRITGRSASRYRLGGALTRHLFNLPTSFGAQTDAYRDRLLSLGVEPGRVEVLGNLKHDREPSPLASRAGQVRELLGWGSGEARVLVAGSTHPGEESLFCGIHADLRRSDPRARLVLVPRHVERLSDAELGRWGAAAPMLRWSAVRTEIAQGVPVHAGDRILVVDTVGELELFYALADLVYVGGSLVGRGGHNLFEAARLGRPVLFGPSYHNFQEEGDLLLLEGAAISVPDAAALRDSVVRLLAHPAEAEALGARARVVTGRLKGATRKHLEWIGRHLRLYLGRDAC